MPGAVFAKILYMDLIGCYCIGVVLLARWLMIKFGCERKYIYYLWLVVFLNLSVPVSISGMFSLIPRQMTELSEAAGTGETVLPETEDETGMWEDTHVYSFADEQTASGTDVEENDSLTADDFPPRKASEEAGRNLTDGSVNLKNPQIRGNMLNAAGTIWLLGVLGLVIANLVSGNRFRKELSKKRKVVWNETERIAEIEGLHAPFLWGLFRPVICLPSGMEEEEKQYIISHEYCHRKRKDHLIKFVIYTVTAIHWFNPLVWMACGLCCKDMEISCDEAVLSGSGPKIRKAYAESLLKYAAKQNRYVISSLTFGEPSVKSRIQNVLRYKKRSVWISILALVCVVAVAAGLLTRPAEQTEDGQAETQESNQETPEVSEETQDPVLPEVVNNGGEVIQVDGELYHIDGQKLYSNGEKVYTSRMDENASWAVYACNLDGSSYEKLLDGRIVGWADEWNCPYVLTTPADTEMGMPGVPGLFLLGELNLSAVAYTTNQFLGVDGEYAYFARTEEEGIYIDRYWAGDGKITENFIGTTLEAELITDFYAEGDYLLFAAGTVQENTGYLEEDFYSYNQTPGRLFREHLTDESTFYAADGYLYYEKYSNQSGEMNGLYRVSYDLTGEELIGEDYRFGAFDESNGTLIVQKRTPDVYPSGSGYTYGSLARINPDGSGEQMLLDVEQMVEDSGNSEETLIAGADPGWNLEEGDDVRLSEINVLGDAISVKAEQRGHREEISEDRTVNLIQSVYLLVNRDGSGWRTWNPEQLRQERDPHFVFSQSVPGKPCDPNEEGWDLAQATGGDALTALAETPEPGDQIYLIGQTENYALYGSGDYESMLLEFQGKYAQIRYPYIFGDMILPDLMEFDYDQDGTEELAIKLNIWNRTDYYIDSFLMADLSADGELFVYQFTMRDITAQLLAHLSSRQTEAGLQAYVEDIPAGPTMADDDMGAYDRVSVGNQVRFYYGDCRVLVGAGIEFCSDEIQRAEPVFNDYQIQAELSYADGGQFTLISYAGRNWRLEEAVRTALAENYMRRDPDEKDTCIRIDEIRYRLEDLEKDTVEVEAVILPVGSESYDYALMELTRTDDVWKVSNILYEK